MERQNKKIKLTEEVEGTPVPEIMKCVFMGSLLGVMNRFQDGKTALKKKFQLCLNEMQAKFEAHEKRKQLFTYQGNVLYSGFMLVKTTLIDDIKVLILWDKFQPSNVFLEEEVNVEGELFRNFPCRLSFKQRFQAVFGTSWMHMRMILYFTHTHTHTRTLMHKVHAHS